MLGGVGAKLYLALRVAARFSVCGLSGNGSETRQRRSLRRRSRRRNAAPLAIGPTDAASASFAKPTATSPENAAGPDADEHRQTYNNTLEAPSAINVRPKPLSMPPLHQAGARENATTTGRWQSCNHFVLERRRISRSVVTSRSNTEVPLGSRRP